MNKCTVQDCRSEASDFASTTGIIKYCYCGRQVNVLLDSTVRNLYTGDMELHYVRARCPKAKWWSVLLGRHVDEPYQIRSGRWILARGGD